jgi:hypothetical protein
MPREVILYRIALILEWITFSPHRDRAVIITPCEFTVPSRRQILQAKTNNQQVIHVPSYQRLGAKTTSNPELSRNS